MGQNSGIYLPGKPLAMTAPIPAQSIPQSADPASAPTLQLLPRQEAFCRYVADGLALAQAARMAGYSWDAARQQGSRLITYPHVAARIAELIHARDQQRRSELDELVGVLKRVMTNGLSRGHDPSVLRAVDMIARLRGLTHNPAHACTGFDDGDAVSDPPSRKAAHTAGAFEPYADPAITLDPDMDPDFDPDLDRTAAPVDDPDEVVAFIPPMPPAAAAPVEPAPIPPPPDRSERWDEATRAMMDRSARICSRMTRLKEAHPKADLDTMEDSDLFFDDDTDSILPPDQWPIRPAPGQPLVPRHTLTPEQIARAGELAREHRRKYAASRE